MGRWNPEVDGITFDDEFPLVNLEVIDDSDAETNANEALVRSVHEALEKFGKVNKKIAPETILAVSTIREAGKLADSTMPHLKVEFLKKQTILEMADPLERLEAVY